MSYDLYLYPERYNQVEIADWFSQRRNYELRGDGVYYFNPETGVYFSFYFETAPAVDEMGCECSEVKAPHIAFNINFYRPHIFGLEAEPEIAAFVKAFNCRIEDPQMDGVGDGPYSRDGFLSGWNKGNRFGYEAIASHGGDGRTVYANGDKIEKSWTWNYNRQTHQAAMSLQAEDVFVPSVLWGRRPGSDAPLSFVTWTLNVPTIIPSFVDALLLIRPKKGILRSLFGGEKKADMALVDLTDLLKTRVLTQSAGIPDEGWRASGSASAFKVVGAFAFFSSTPSDIFDPLTMDKVLDAELRPD